MKTFNQLYADALVTEAEKEIKTWPSYKHWAADADHETLAAHLQANGKSAKHNINAGVRKGSQERVNAIHDELMKRRMKMYKEDVDTGAIDKLISLAESLMETGVMESTGDHYAEAKKIIKAHASKESATGHPDNYESQHIVSVHKDKVDALHTKLKDAGYKHEGIAKHGGHVFTKGSATVSVSSKPDTDKAGYMKEAGAKTIGHHQVVASHWMKK